MAKPYGKPDFVAQLRAFSPQFRYASDMHLLATSDAGLPVTAYFLMVLMLLVFPAVFATAAEYIERAFTRRQDDSDS